MIKNTMSKEEKRSSTGLLKLSGRGNGRRERMYKEVINDDFKCLKKKHGFQSRTACPKKFN